MTRDSIRLPSVLGDHRQPDNSWDFMLDDQKKIGYVRLTHVGRESAGEMESALEDLQGRGLKALILDVRNNPGGLLDGAIEIADQFVESGKILIVKSRQDETVYEAKAEGTFSGFPVALIVNRKTASAGEIVAACLQDHHRAVVIGERTMGHGIVRSILKLNNGIGAVKLPIAAYYRPSGKAMNRYPYSTEADDWGVRPDPGYEIPLTEEQIKQHETWRAARDVVTGEPAAPSKNEPADPPLQRALQWIEARLAQPTAPAPVSTRKP